MKQKREKQVDYSKRYTRRNFWLKVGMFFKWRIKDSIERAKNPNQFEEYGLTMYCGRQGAGKTVAMTEYLERMRVLYPNAIIVTNYDYKHQTQPLTDWKDFFNLKNGTDGIIFAIDEIQNEFSSTAWKNFPESLLTEITQQRKQRVKIVATSQIFTRVAKPLREQCMEVADCFTIGGRWTWVKCFDAVEYNATIDSPTAKSNITRLYRKNFIQDDYLRNCYDSYAKIERIGRTEFMSKQERLG